MKIRTKILAFLRHSTKMRNIKGGVDSLRHTLFKDGFVVRNFKARKFLSLDALQQKQIREKALADAFAKEEEAKAREKAAREARGRAQARISSVNKSSWDVAIAQSSDRYSEVTTSATFQQLDSEIEDLLSNKLRLPSFKVSNRPWIKESSEATPQTRGGESLSQRIQTTTKTQGSNFPNLKPTPDYKPYSDSELFLRHLIHTGKSGKLGSQLVDVHQAIDARENPQPISEISISHLMSAGCHFGHSKSLWRPSTQPYIFGEYQGTHLIDLNETLAALKRAAHVIKDVSRKGGLVLYVGTGKLVEQHRALERAAERSGGYYVSRRWIPGTITNALEVTKQLGGVQKVEVNMGDDITLRNISQDGTIKPDIVIILNPVENRNVINECTIARIPTIGLSDTDMEPSLLSYPIPCNDDSIRAITLVLGVLSRAAEEGVQERKGYFQKFSSVKSSALV